ncbi:unnamed protein product, partial [Porites lobata]
MYKCGIGKLSGTECGSVTVKDTVINEYQALSDCQRDITGHLEMLKMRGEDVLSEKELILLRAGVFSGTAEVDFMVCPKHRDTFGLKWRGRKKICQVPEGVASHRSKNHTDGAARYGRKLSEEIFNRTGSLIPIGSGIQPLFQPSSSQEETQSTTSTLDDSISQATCAQYLKPPDNTDEGKVAALQWFVDECSTGPLGSIMKRPWTDATSKTRECYIRKASTIISEVLKTVAPQSAPELWEAVRGKNEVSHLLGSVHNGSDLLLAVVESYKQADTSKTRRQLLSLVASKVTYAELVAYIPRLTRYEFTAARRYALEVGAGLTVQSEAKQIREK